MNVFRQRIAARTRCADCDETDPSVLLRCRDNATRCAHHANVAGWCWGCGEREPQFNGDEELDGLCPDCRSEDGTAKRIYVEYVAGSRGALNGSAQARYVATADLLITDGTPEQLAALERANAAYRAEHQAIEERASAAHLANRAVLNAAIRAIVEEQP